MIKEYENNYAKYFEDQMTKFESFEGELYYKQIQETVNYIFSNESRDKTILDFCCGDGTASLILSEMGFEMTGIDGNNNKIKVAAKKCRNTLFFTLHANEVSILDDGYNFDIIYASHCFEHFINPINILLDVSKLLNRDGKIILILPYPNEESEGHPGSAELRLNKELPEVQSLFEENGFIVSRIEKMNIREPEILIELKCNSVQ